MEEEGGCSYLFFKFLALSRHYVVIPSGWVAKVTGCSTGEQCYLFAGLFGFTCRHVLVRVLAKVL